MKLQLANSPATALVDDRDFEWLSQWKWYLHKGGYAYRQTSKGGVRKNIYMHREINQTPPGLDTDHVNRNRLDNRRANLRALSRSDNLRNTKIQGFEKNHNMFSARVKFKGKRYYVGTFATIQEAVAARLEKVKELELEYARTV